MNSCALSFLKSEGTLPSTSARPHMHPEPPRGGCRLRGAVLGLRTWVLAPALWLGRSWGRWGAWVSSLSRTVGVSPALSGAVPRL